MARSSASASRDNIWKKKGAWVFTEFSSLFFAILNTEAPASDMLAGCPSRLIPEAIGQRQLPRHVVRIRLCITDRSHHCGVEIVQAGRAHDAHADHRAVLEKIDFTDHGRVSGDFVFGRIVQMGLDVDPEFL